MNNMLDQLQMLVNEAGQQHVVQNPEIPNEQNDAVLQETNTSLMAGLQQLMQQQGPAGLKQLFAGVQQGDAPEANPAMQQVTSNVSGGLMDKLGLNSGMAKNIAGMLVPVVLGKLFNRTKDPNDKGFDLGGLLGSLMGGSGGAAAPAPGGAQGGGMMGNLSRIGASMGLDKDGDGDTDLQDLMKMFR